MRSIVIRTVRAYVNFRKQVCGAPFPFFFGFFVVVKHTTSGIAQNFIEKNFIYEQDNICGCASQFFVGKSIQRMR